MVILRGCDIAPAGKEENVRTLGVSSLLFGACSLGPSKDTLWTNASETMFPLWTNTTEVQPHVTLDAVLATLSLGPVGISDGYNMTDVGLIGQAYRSSTDGTLLRPSRPLSAVDSALLNQSANEPCTGAACNVSSVRATHSSIPVLVHSGLDQAELQTHYVVAWGTRRATTLLETDLYPPPRRDMKLAVREHIFDFGPGQAAGCAAGQQASRGCITVLQAGAPRVIPDTIGGQVRLLVYHEPLSNGAYLLGELGKFVHVSPQRFSSITLGGSSPCGFFVEVMGAIGENVSVVAVDNTGIVRVADVQIRTSGRAVVAL